MKLTILGCTGSMSGPQGPASAYLLQATAPASAAPASAARPSIATTSIATTSTATTSTATTSTDTRTWSLILDLGPGGMGRLLAYLDPHDVDAIVISHCHADHMADMVGMQVYRRWWPAGPLGAVDVFAPAGAQARVRGLSGDDPAETYATEFHFYAHKPGKTWSVGPFKLTSYPVVHPVEAYALRIVGPSETGGQAVFTYSGDTDFCPELIEAAQDADLFLCEAAFQRGRDTVRGVHLDGWRAGEAAAQAGVKQLVLTHLQPWTDPEQTLADARQHYQDGPLWVAKRDDVYTC